MKAKPNAPSIGLLVALLTLLGVGVEVVAAQPNMKLPEFEQHTLDNGMVVMIMEHHSVPLVSIDLWIDAGATTDPAGQEGLAALTAASLRKGAAGKSAFEFAEHVDFLGAEFDANVNLDRTRINVECLSKDFDTGTELLADAVLRPNLDPEEIDKLREQMADDVRERKDNPRWVLGSYHRASLYGDHPYGRPIDGTELSLPELGQKDVQSFHRDYYGADRAILAVVGDVRPSDVLAKITEMFGEMPKANAPAVVLDAPIPVVGRRVLLVNKDDTPQTWFRMGNVGPSWGSPDYAAVEVVRTIFGGRFTSWLNSALRIDSGLTYGASFRMNRGAVGGPAYISTFTATETTKEAVDMALATLERLHKDGIGEEDLASAKAYMKGQRPYDFETGGALARALCHITFYDLGRGYVDDFFAQVDAVTPEDCRRVIAQWFPSQNMVFTAIGVSDEVSSILEEYGPLQTRQNSDPGFSAVPSAN